MDIRTLTLVNLIFLFLYAAIMLVNSSIYGEVRGGTWFAWSNLSRGVALLLLTLSTTLPRFLSTVVGDVLLVVGLMLLHRGLAEGSPSRSFSGSATPPSSSAATPRH